MKYKNYGNNKEFDSGLNLELIQKNDDVSDRNINRPLINLNENQEEIYEILNNLTKTVYGNKPGTLPGIYEDFDAEGFIINSFKNDSKNFYIRIPTGAMLLTTNKESGLNYYNFGEKEYKDSFSDINLTNDKFRSFSYINRPNINLLERQLADLIGLDLNDLENDIKVEATEVPISYPVYILDKDQFPISDNSGNFKKVYLEGKEIFNCSKDNAEYYTPKENIINQNRKVHLPNDPKGDASKDFTINRLFVTQSAEDQEFDTSIFKEVTEDTPEEGNLFFTTNLDKAIKAIDYNGEEKKRIGYNIKASISTEIGTKDIYLPNKKENTNWNIFLPAKEATLNGGVYKVLFEEKNSSEVLSFTFKITAKASAAEVNNNLLRAFLTNDKANKVYNVQRIQNKKGVDTIEGVKIESKVADEVYNGYYITITLDDVPVLSAFSGEAITDAPANPLVKQKYYYNIFELVNGFTSASPEGLGDYLTANSNLYNSISGETILKLSNNENKQKDYYVYYDLNFDTNKNKNSPSYDKSGRLFVSEKEEPANNLIKLFVLKITGKNEELSRSKPKIDEITFAFNKLDKKAIYTKMLNSNSLSISKRTELKKHFRFLDNDSQIGGKAERAIEINSIESETGDKQSRIYSPILRLSTSEEIQASDDYAQADYAQSADAPDNFSDSYIPNNLLTGKAETEKFHTNSDTGIGLILNKDKGARLYSGGENPIELVSKTGNINIINTNGTGKIGLKSLTDTDGVNIDLLGITQIRSRNDNQLIINRSVGDDNAKAAIKFQNKGKNLGNIELYFSEGNKNFNLNLDNGSSLTNVINSTIDLTKIRRTLSVNDTGNSTDDKALEVKGETKITGDTSIKSSDKLSSFVLNNKSTDLTTPITTITSSDNIALSGSKQIELTSGSSTATLVPTSITLNNTTGSNNSKIELNSSGNSIINGSAKTELKSGSSDISLVPTSITLQNTESSKLSIDNNSIDLSTPTTIDLSAPTTNINSSTKIDLKSNTSANSSNISLVPTSIGITSTNVNIKGTTKITGTTTSTELLTASKGITITSIGLDVKAGGATINGKTTMNSGAEIKNGLNISSGGASIQANQILSLGTAKIKADASGNIIFSW